jgi:TonB family protein
LSQLWIALLLPLALAALVFLGGSMAAKLFDYTQAHPAVARKITMAIVMGYALLRLGVSVVRLSHPAPDWHMSPGTSYPIRATLVHRVEPVYPPAARQARIEGTVRFSALINPDGTVYQVKVMSGSPLLVSAAIDAVQQWIYSPVMVNGKASAAWTDIEISFRLKAPADSSR